MTVNLKGTIELYLISNKLHEEYKSEHAEKNLKIRDGE